MSEFDKEAERERLREKYEKDRADRESTERMSELLLQGATMTNTHCDACGSPIFRYDGQEFCPTCQQQAQGGGEAGAGDAQTARGQSQADQAGQAETTQGTAQAQGASRGSSQSEATPASGATEGQQTGEEAAGTADRQSTDAGQQPVGQRGTNQRQPAPSGTASDAGAVTATNAGGPGEGADARAALADSITALARRAAEADDPRQARDLLAAAREAAEALDALDR